jgi:hypothetical protein
MCCFYYVFFSNHWKTHNNARGIKLVLLKQFAFNDFFCNPWNTEAFFYSTAGGEKTGRVTYRIRDQMEWNRSNGG